MRDLFAPFAAFWQMRHGHLRDRAAVEAWQAARIARFRRKVMPRSPFYAALAQTPFDALPAMDRDRMMAAFDRINTVGLTRERAEAMAMAAETGGPATENGLAAGFSTGTSGRRGLFLTNRAERALWAGAVLGRFWPRPSLARQRIALFLRADNQLYQTLGNRLVSFDFFSIGEDVERQTARLSKVNPTVLIGPPSALMRLAQAQESGALALTPRRVLAGAEVLEPQDADTLTRVFGPRPDIIYQCTEGVLAMTCRAGRLHLNERFVQFRRQVIDPDSGAFVPIINDFTRSTLPVLNYRLDDILVPDPRPCPCGCASARILRIEGRERDAVFWRGPQGRRWISADALRRAVLGSGANDWAAEQSGETLRIFTPRPADEAAIRSAIKGLALRRACTPPMLEFRTGLPPQQGPKRQRIRVIPQT